MSKFEQMSDEYLRKSYVPDVYQKSIYAIDYQRLKDAGIKLISFDIDDTIAGLEDFDPPKAAKTLFENLKNMGFEVWLLTNARDKRGEHFAQELGVKGQYIARAEKPLTSHFQELQNRHGIDKTEMAHVGNSITDDIAGGKAFGITTCLVRRAGKLTKPKSLIKTDGRKLRDELEKRGIWRKHHKDNKGDQYYQLKEIPPCRR